MKSRIVGTIAVAAGLAAVTTVPAATAASTFACTGFTQGYLLAVGYGSTDKGALYSYPYSSMDKDTVGTFSARTKIGNSGWDQFGAIRGGSAGFLWAFKSDGTLHAYDWNVGQTTWSRQNTIVAAPSGQSAPWASFTSAAGKKKVTVDSKNQIFTLDSSGRVLKYSYSFTTSSWTTWAKPVAQLSTSYDMLWASDNTTLWARTKTGTLTRLRLDATSDRVVARFDGGTGWGSFKNIFSGGGDTKFTIVNTGGLKKYRFNEDVTWWANNGIVLSTSTGWSSFLDTTAVANTCSRTYPVPTASVPPQPNTPIEALGSSTSGQIALVYANAVAEGKFALIDNSTGNAATWSTVNDADGMVGRPALTQPADGKIRVFSQGTTGLTNEKTQLTTGAPGLSASTDHGGVLTGQTDTAVMSNGTTVLAASDATGAVWARQQLGTQYAAWRQVATGVAPNAIVTAQPAAPNTVALHAVTANGSVATTTVPSTGAFPAAPPAVTDLGVPGSGATGTVAAMSYTTGAQRLAVTDTSGQVWTKAQNIATLIWDTSWTPIAGSVSGSPSIVLSPASSRVHVVARSSADNQVVLASEVSQGSGSFADFSPIVDEWGSPAAEQRALIADPTTFTFLTVDGTRRWGIVGYDASRNLWAWYSSSSSGTNQLQRGSAPEPLEITRLGKLPR